MFSQDLYSLVSY